MAAKHKLVIRLKGGDPYVFGRGGEEALYLIERNVDVEVVPGISSSIAALSAAGIPITHRGLSKGFQVITAHSKKDALADIDYSQLTDDTVTYVFLMGLAHVGEIADGLIAAGRSPETKAAVISSGTTNRQKKVCGTLEDIEEKVTKAKLESPAVIVVGDVVGLGNKLNFFEQRPLFGRKIFLPVIKGFEYSLGGRNEITCENELEKKLTEAGADVVTVCSGAIRPVKFEFDFLSETDENSIFVFTSANSVKAFFWNFFEVNNYDLRKLTKIKFATVGKTTADALKSFGFNADFISEKQTGKDLADFLNEEVISKSEVYWFCQNNSSVDFEEALDGSFLLKKVICYENVSLDKTIDSQLIENVSNCEFAVFTSGSSAEFAITNIGDAVPSKIISIGPACSRKIRQLGRNVYREASVSSYDGIMELMSEFRS
mgnify:FL=1